jgi:hypothetical protein
MNELIADGTLDKDKTDTIRLRNSTIERLKELGLSNYNNDKTYDAIVMMLIREYRKQQKDKQWSRDHPFSPANPNPDTPL